MLDKQFVILGVLSLICHLFTFILFLMENPVADNVHVDPDQMPHHVPPVLGLHCLPMTLF